MSVSFSVILKPKKQKLVRKEGEENTLKLLKSTTPSNIFISCLTIMEVNYGLAINPQRALKIQSLIEELLGSI